MAYKRSHVRALSLLLIVAMVALVGFNFWGGRLAGDPVELLPPYKHMRTDPAPGFEQDFHTLKEGPDLKFVPEVSSLQRGLTDWYMHKRIPFIARGVNKREFKGVTRAAILKGLLRSNETLELYTSEEDDSGDDQLARDAVARWEQDLPVLIIDAPVDNLIKIPEVLSKYNGYAGVNAYNRSLFGDASQRRDVSIQLASTDYYTSLHSDPPDMGGGWVYSADGEKDWILVPRTYLHHSRTDDLQPMMYGTLEELRALNRRLLASHERRMQELAKEQLGEKKDWSKLSAEEKRDDILPFRDDIGPIYVANLRKGDLLCWPPGWMHKVHTTRQFIGLGSYVMFPKDREELDAGLREAIKWARGSEQHPWGYYEFAPHP